MRQTVKRIIQIRVHLQRILKKIYQMHGFQTISSKQLFPTCKAAKIQSQVQNARYSVNLLLKPNSTYGFEVSLFWPAKLAFPAELQL